MRNQKKGKTMKNRTDTTNTVPPIRSNTESAAQVAAAILWDRFTEDERNLVRFGLIPHWTVSEYPIDITVDGLDLSLALMDCAKQDGGMVA